MARRIETERKRTVKPPLRFLPEDERNELLNVRSYFFFFFFFFLLFFFIFPPPLFPSSRRPLRPLTRFVLRAGIKNQLGRIAQGVFAATHGHRHRAKSEKENHAGKATEQLGERHRPVGEKLVDIRVPRLVGLILRDSRSHPTANRLCFKFVLFTRVSKFNRNICGCIDR